MSIIRSSKGATPSKIGAGKQSGSTLIEVLVSLLVLSFGMLGMAGVQGVSLKANQSAYYRTMATTFTADIVERMRANLVAVGNGNYDDITGAATDTCFTTAGCSGAQMAAQDVLDWSAAITAALPLGASVVCRDSTPTDGSAAATACDGAGAIYAIKIWWDDDRDGTADQIFTTTFRPI
ncbi:MAG: type IV pilus modification protein PilV [SAR86 cluster bacterium]|uniref:Type IV pilus modification protein PilV n=1 Tax=SAR86 cluster bacterium TaxID=2030880 RepID=A0A2A5AEA5_9GAMM|nr:MAG: type IV pilus modification protein PilV [SAR86 cluster bacterium]